MEEIVYLNGELVPWSQAKVSVYDQGFLYGYALFETMRAYNGKIFLLERHLDRLRSSAGVIGFSPELAGIDLRQACRDTLGANNVRDARLRLTVSNGEVDSGHWTEIGSAPTVVVTARNYIPLAVEVYETGYKAGVASMRRCSQSPICRMKSANYLHSLLARREAGKYGLDEALLLNERGLVAEGSVSNVFFVRDSVLVTPSPESGILPGITRGVVMEIAGGLGIKVTEGEVRLSDLEQFDEAFLTNSVIELMPLVEVRDGAGKMAEIGSGKPGAVTRKMMAAYRETVARETSGE